MLKSESQKAEKLSYENLTKPNISEHIKAAVKALINSSFRGRVDE